MKIRNVSVSFLAVLLLVSAGVPLRGLAAARVEQWELTIERKVPGQVPDVDTAVSPGYMIVNVVDPAPVPSGIVVR
jgi:hypothetical protein